MTGHCPTSTTTSHRHWWRQTTRWTTSAVTTHWPTTCGRRQPCPLSPRVSRRRVIPPPMTTDCWQMTTLNFMSCWRLTYEWGHNDVTVTWTTNSTKSGRTKNDTYFVDISNTTGRPWGLEKEEPLYTITRITEMIFGNMFQLSNSLKKWGSFDPPPNFHWGLTWPPEAAPTAVAVAAAEMTITVLQIIKSVFS